MKTQIFSDNDWLYPDSELTGHSTAVQLDAARGAGDCFQVLTDSVISGPTAFKVTWRFAGDTRGISIICHQLVPAQVEENSGEKLFTTLDYESVKSFVTRKAPFDVFDITREIDDGYLKEGRLAFYFQVKVASDVFPGVYTGSIDITAGTEHALLSVELKVYRAFVPLISKATFSMVNWLKLESIQYGHHITQDSPEYWSLVQKYLKNQIDMRNTHLQLPSGAPIRDTHGAVIDFDFNECEILGNMALKSGYKYIYGGFVARFKQWDKPDHFLLWDRDVSVASFEGYRQLHIYFQKLNIIINKNHWTRQYMQGLVDEPQFANSDQYRMLSAICRKMLAGVTIIDPVETTEIYGAVDIWVVKQAIYDQYKVSFDRIASLGEDLWVYTCGFPAGYMMNRSTDLPLLAGRLPMWMCYAYGLKGFLHWGYNAYNKDPFLFSCWDASSESEKRLLPPGDGFIVYPGEEGPINSVRSHLQRSGSEEVELLYLLDQYNRDEAMRIAHCVCQSFSDYETSPEIFKQVRRELLESLDLYMS
jgi:hypothetical protein